MDIEHFYRADIDLDRWVNSIKNISQPKAIITKATVIERFISWQGSFPRRGNPFLGFLDVMLDKLVFIQLKLHPTLKAK